MIGKEMYKKEIDHIKKTYQEELDLFLKDNKI